MEVKTDEILGTRVERLMKEIQRGIEPFLVIRKKIVFVVFRKIKTTLNQ